MTAVSIHPSNTSHALAEQVAELRKQARVAMAEATKLAADEMRRLAPGSIGEHIEQRVGAGGPGTVTGIVFPADKIAKYVDEGTGVYVAFHHDIVAKSTRPRATMRLKGGQFRRRVRGQRPQRFRDRAERAIESRVIDVLERPATTVPARLG